MVAKHLGDFPKFTSFPNIFDFVLGLRYLVSVIHQAIQAIAYYSFFQLMGLHLVDEQQATGVKRWPMGKEGELYYYLDHKEPECLEALLNLVGLEG